MSSVYRRIRLAILQRLYHSLLREWAYRRLPRPRSGYKEYWVNQGPVYRSATLKADQSRHGMWECPDKKTLVEVIAKYSPESVLDVGCGYGRHLEWLTPHFEKVVGCDISEKLLAQVPPGLATFNIDIVTDRIPDKYDVVFCWALLMYFIDKPEQATAVLRHLEAGAKKKVILWEWEHVCDYMSELYPSDIIEFHVIPLTAV